MTEERTTHENRSEQTKRDCPRLSCKDLLHEEKNDHFEGAMIDPTVHTRLLTDEDSLFELLRDLGEENASLPFTVLLRFDPADREGASLRTQVRALFRAAVYGRFSLLLGGILTNADLRHAMGEVHSVFCELESEEREFNGYIPKGILIDTPLSLHITATEGVDFICLDVSTLCHLFTGLSHAERCARKDSTLYVTVLESLDAFLLGLSKSFDRALSKTACLAESHPHEEFLQWLSDRGFAELFLPAAAIEKARIRLSAMQPSPSKIRRKDAPKK